MKILLTLCTLVACGQLIGEEIKLQFLPNTAVQQDISYQSKMEGSYMDNSYSMKFRGIITAKSKNWMSLEKPPFYLTYILKKFEGKNIDTAKKELLHVPLNITIGENIQLENSLYKTPDTHDTETLIKTALDLTFLCANKNLEVGKVWLMDDEENQSTGHLIVKKITADSVIVHFELNQVSQKGGLSQTVKMGGECRYQLNNGFVNEMKVEGKTKTAGLFKTKWTLSIKSAPKY
jgi:hypothetical protein